MILDQLAERVMALQAQVNPGRPPVPMVGRAAPGSADFGYFLNVEPGGFGWWSGDDRGGHAHDTFPDGSPAVFPDEESACEWLWQVIEGDMTRERREIAKRPDEVVQEQIGRARDEIGRLTPVELQHSPFVPGTEVPAELRPGDVVERITRGRSNGRYASAENTPLPERSLPPDRLLPFGFVTLRYEVLRTPPRVTQGLLRPWFGQPGGGVEYYFADGLEWNVREGYLR